MPSYPYNGNNLSLICHTNSQTIAGTGGTVALFSRKLPQTASSDDAAYRCGVIHLGSIGVIKKMPRQNVRKKCHSRELPKWMFPHLYALQLSRLWQLAQLVSPLSPQRRSLQLFFGQQAKR